MMKPSSVKKVMTGSNIPKPLNSSTSKIINEKKINEQKPQMCKTTTKAPSLNKPSKPISTGSSSKNIVNPIKSIVQKKVQSKIETKIVRPINKFTNPSSKEIIPKKATKTSFSKVENNKNQENKVISSWGYLPYDLFLLVCHFYSKTTYDIYFLSLVCRGWRFNLCTDDSKYCWMLIKDCQKMQSFYEIKQKLQSNLAVQRQKMAVQYQNLFIKLFNYGSTKENIPNKLIEKLNLQISLTINKKTQLNKIPFKLKTYNFSSYLCFKVTEIQDFKYDFYSPHNMFKDKLSVKVKFFSRRYKVNHQISYEWNPQDIVQCAIRQKAFNYYLQKNMIVTFFEGDNHFLYFFFQISALELVNIFRTSIAESQKQIISKALKKTPLYKKLAVTQFQSFTQYMKFQADFQLHMSYHNSIKQIFTFCDTKVYPKEYNDKQALIFINIDDTFAKIDTYKLDNKMGISEGVYKLYLLDLTLKDRDKFLITFSGFIYARNAELKQRSLVDNYMNFQENQMKILEFKDKKYEFKILIIQELKKNLIKNIELIFYA